MKPGPPCFVCGKGERLPGHVVCADHHKPTVCHICTPQTWAAFPMRDNVGGKRQPQGAAP